VGSPRRHALGSQSRLPGLMIGLHIGSDRKWTPPVPRHPPPRPHRRPSPACNPLGYLPRPNSDQPGSHSREDVLPARPAQPWCSQRAPRAAGTIPSLVPARAGNPRTLNGSHGPAEGAPAQPRSSNGLSLPLHRPSNGATCGRSLLPPRKAVRFPPGVIKHPTF